MRMVYVILLSYLLVGCGSSKKETEVEIKKAVLEILKAYSNEDFVNLNKLSTSENKNLFNKMIKEGKDPSMFKDWKTEAFAVKSMWNGKGNSFEVIFDNKTDEALVKWINIPTTDDVSTLYLLRENGIWRFSNTGHMSKDKWNKIYNNQ